MTEEEGRRSRPRVWAALAVALAVVAVVALVVAVTGQQRAPQPVSAVAEATPAGSSAPVDPGVPAGTEPSPASENPPVEAPAPAAEPVSVSVPAIDVRSELLRLGLNDDGTVEVPPLGPDDKAGWYERGPAPGDIGPAVILGHVDSAEWGPGIFFELGALRPGDRVEVARADDTVAVFAVDRVEQHPKDDFPTIEVYGNTKNPQLRLITCGGTFDPVTRSYKDNVIAFATLVDVRGA